MSTLYRHSTVKYKLKEVLDQNIMSLDKVLANQPGLISRVWYSLSLLSWTDLSFILMSHSGAAGGALSILSFYMHVYIYTWKNVYIRFLKKVRVGSARARFVTPYGNWRTCNSYCNELESIAMIQIFRVARKIGNCRYCLQLPEDTDDALEACSTPGYIKQSFKDS